MAFPWPDTSPTAPHRAAFADATVRPYWLDALPPRDPEPQLDGPVEADVEYAYCLVDYQCLFGEAKVSAPTDAPRG